MMRSLSSAVAGLRTHQTKMDVIGNNIANVNTYGFKASRTTFADVYYQNLSSGNAASGSVSGGTNPTQIGYGSSVATIDTIVSQSGSSSTDRALDVYISGDGFLVSKDASGKFQYTRLGNLGFDAAGNLVDGNGHLIQGFPMNSDGTPRISSDGTILGDELQVINVNPDLLDRLTGISISSSGAIVGLLPGDPMLKVSSSLPDWMNGNKLSIPTNSTYSGAVKVALSGYTDKTTMAKALGNIDPNSITGIEMGELALPASGDYTVSISNKGVITVSLPAKLPDHEAVSLTGSLQNGKLVLADKSGKVGLTINFDKENLPDIKTTMQTNIKELTTTNTTAYPMYKGDGSGDLITDANGKPLYASQVTDDPALGGTALKNDDGTPQLDPVSNLPLFVLKGPVTENVPNTLSLELYAQMSTTDKGGNKLKFPEDPVKYNNETTLQFDEVTLEITDTNAVKAFNGVIGNAETAEGERINIGNLVLAKFRNPSGLQQGGTSYFNETFNSGAAIFVRPGLEGTGGLNAGYLEMSNVDISKEFSDMITTQRGFQANTRIVSVSDEMLQELVNLKR